MATLKKSISYAAGFYGQSFECFIEYCSAHLVSGIQLIPDQDPNLYSELTGERLARIKLMLDANDIEPSVHNVFYDINICSLVPEVRDFSLRVTDKVAKLARKIGSRTLTVHPGYIYPGWRNDPLQNVRFWKSAKESMALLSAVAQENDIEILLENGSYCLSSRSSANRMDFHVGIEIDELDRLYDGGYKNIGICADVGKLIASQIEPEDFLKHFGKAIKQAQVSSCDEIEILQRHLQSDSTVSVVFEGKDKSELESFIGC